MSPAVEGSTNGAEVLGNSARPIYNEDQRAGRSCALCGQGFAEPEAAEMPNPPMSRLADPNQTMRVCRNRIACVGNRRRNE